MVVDGQAAASWGEGKKNWNTHPESVCFWVGPHRVGARWTIRTAFRESARTTSVSTKGVSMSRVSSDKFPLCGPNWFSLVPTWPPLTAINRYQRPFLCSNNSLRSPRTLETVEEISPQNPWTHEFQAKKKPQLGPRRSKTQSFNR